MNCPNCSAENDFNNIFCTRCGLVVAPERWALPKGGNPHATVGCVVCYADNSSGILTLVAASGLLATFEEGMVARKQYIEDHPHVTHVEWYWSVVKMTQDPSTLLIEVLYALHVDSQGEAKWGNRVGKHLPIIIVKEV